MAKVKFNRKAHAIWEGSGKDGAGHLTTQSEALDQKSYSFETRFETGNKSTNPEELIGAALAGCYAMQLSFLLNEAGYTASRLFADTTVYFEDGEIPKIGLKLEGDVPDIGEEEFNKIATKAKEICPVSKLLNADISLEAEMV